MRRQQNAQNKSDKEWECLNVKINRREACGCM